MDLDKYELKKLDLDIEVVDDDENLLDVYEVINPDVLMRYGFDGFDGSWEHSMHVCPSGEEPTKNNLKPIRLCCDLVMS